MSSPMNKLVCVIDSWAHTSFVHSILSLKLGVTDTISDIEYRTRIRTDLNHSKRIWSRMWLENIRTVFTLLKTNPAV